MFLALKNDLGGASGYAGRVKGFAQMRKQADRKEVSAEDRG